MAEEVEAILAATTEEVGAMGEEAEAALVATVETYVTRAFKEMVDNLAKEEAEANRGGPCVARSPFVAGWPFVARSPRKLH